MSKELTPLDYFIALGQTCLMQSRNYKNNEVALLKNGEKHTTQELGGIVKTALEDYAEIEKMSKQYNIEFNLVNIRHALFTLAQLKGSSGTNWENYNRKLQALEVIKDILDIKFIERPDLDNTMYYAVVVRPKGYEPFGMVKKINSKEEFDLLKEVLL